MKPARSPDLDPLLAFEGGDVVFHTSKRPFGIFVLHKSTLVAKSRYFHGLLSQEWGSKARPIKPGCLPVYELDLEFDRETGFALPVIRVSGDQTYNALC